MADTEARTPQPPDLTRRTLTPFGYAVCVVVPLLIAAAGFTILHFHYDKEQLVSGDRLPILTSDWRAGDPADRSLVTGELVLDDGCLRLSTPDGATVDLVWPADYEATSERVGGGDQLKVYDTDRYIAARSKQTLEIGGGYADASAYAGQPCAPASGEVFLVQSKPKVIGST